MSNLRKRPNPSNLVKLQAYIAKLKAEIKEVSSLIHLQDDDDWLKIKGILRRKLSALDFDLDRFSILDEKTVNAALQARLDIQFFISLIDGGDLALEQLNDKLQVAQEQLISLKERLGE